VSGLWRAEDLETLAGVSTCALTGVGEMRPLMVRGFRGPRGGDDAEHKHHRDCS
jgi:hypothetical protein